MAMDEWILLSSLIQMLIPIFYPFFFQHILRIFFMGFFTACVLYGFGVLFFNEVVDTLMAKVNCSLFRFLIPTERLY